MITCFNRYYKTLIKSYIRLQYDVYKQNGATNQRNTTFEEGINIERENDEFQSCVKDPTGSCWSTESKLPSCGSASKDQSFHLF